MVRGDDHRRAYDLAVHAREADALDWVMAGCTSTRVMFEETEATTTMSGTSTGWQSGTDGISALDRWHDNGNDRTVCPEARRHGIALRQCFADTWHTLYA